MVPGKTYRPEDIVQIAWHRKWWIIVPFIVVAVGTYLYVRQLPELYRSTTTIMVMPQRVPENYVRPTVRDDVRDRLLSMQTQIMSRTRLEAIMTDLDLYAAPRRAGALTEDLVERMRNDIFIETVQADTFRVSFVSSSPQTAMRVTERLAQLFIDENLRQREAIAQGANQFLNSQLEEARQRLIEQERRLEAYRRAHAGELPDQLDSNLSFIENIQGQLQSLLSVEARDREWRLKLEQERAALGEPPEPMSQEELMAKADGTLPVGTLAQQLDAARRQLTAMQLRLKDTHPDIGRMKRVIAQLEERAEAEALSQPLTGEVAEVTPTGASVFEGQKYRSRSDKVEAQRIKAIELQLEELDTREKQRDAEEARLRSLMTSYQSRAEAAPTRQTELIELTRDYETIQQLYRSLLQKSEESKMAADLESRQIGEQFRVIDPARIPQRPFSPNRERLNFLGAVIGLGCGLFLVALLEYRDSSLKSDEDVLVALSLPVLAMIPVMSTTEERARRRRMRLAVAAGSLVLVVAAAALVAAFVLRT